MANCQIDLEVKNTGDRKFIINNTFKSGLKIKGGTWKNLQWGGRYDYFDEVVVTPGNEAYNELYVLFNCGPKRR